MKILRIIFLSFIFCLGLATSGTLLAEASNIDQSVEDCDCDSTEYREESVKRLLPDENLDNKDKANEEEIKQQIRESKNGYIENESEFIILDDNGNVSTLDKSEFKKVSDENGIEVFIEKIHLSEFENMKKMYGFDLNKNEAIKESEKLEQGSIPQELEVGDTFILNKEESKEVLCEDVGTQSMPSNCDVYKIKKEVKIIDKRWIEDRWGPDLYCIGSICIPTIGTWSYCEFELDYYETEQWRCCHYTCGYTWQPRQYKRNFYSYGPCTYGEVGQWKNY